MAEDAVDMVTFEVKETAVSGASLNRRDGEFIECHSCGSKGSTGVTHRSSVDVADYVEEFSSSTTPDK
jgi:hypothetical protein